MKKRLLALAGACMLLTLVAGAQQKDAAAQGPRPKSQKETEALQKVQTAAQTNDPKATLAAISEVLENFTDTAFKPMLLNMAVQAAQQTGDYAETLVWGERVLQAEPNNVQARVTMAETIAANSKPTDLDKDQSIKKIKDNATQALTLMSGATAESEGVPAPQWAPVKARMTSEAHDALGQAAALDKKYPDAVKEFQAGADADPGNSLVLARLTKVYNDSKQYDQAIATADKVLAMKDCPTADNSPCLPPQVKTYVAAQKNLATKLKPAAGGGAASSSTAPATGSSTPATTPPPTTK